MDHQKLKLVLFFFSFFSVFASADEIDFNSSGDLNEFLPTLPSSAYTYSSTGGLNDSGCLSIVTSGSSYLAYSGSEFSGEENLRISAYFTTPDIVLGFVDPNYYGSQYPSPQQPSLYAQFAGNGVELFSVNEPLAYGGVNDSFTSPWYYAQFEINYLGTTSSVINGYEFEGDFYEANSSGEIGSLIGSATVTLGTGVFQGSPYVTGFIGSQGSIIGNLDNLEVAAVPEPSISLLVFVGGMGFIAISYARNRKSLV